MRGKWHPEGTRSPFSWPQALSEPAGLDRIAGAWVASPRRHGHENDYGAGCDLLAGLGRPGPGPILAQGSLLRRRRMGRYPVGQVNTSRMIAAQNQQLGQVAAMGQNLVVQSGIRNTLTSQAQDRTDAIMSQHQANQNWWSQVQTQQMERRQAHEYGRRRPWPLVWARDSRRAVSPRPVLPHGGHRHHQVAPCVAGAGICVLPDANRKRPIAARPPA